MTNEGQEIPSQFTQPVFSDNGRYANKDIIPYAFINYAVGRVLSVQSISGEEPFILAVDNLESVLTESMRKRLQIHLDENKAEIEEKQKSVPSSWSENVQGWEDYILARYLRRFIMRAIYETISEKKDGLISRFSLKTEEDKDPVIEVESDKDSKETEISPESDKEIKEAIISVESEKEIIEEIQSEKIEI